MLGYSELRGLGESRELLCPLACLNRADFKRICSRLGYVELTRAQATGCTNHREMRERKAFSSHVLYDVQSISVQTRISHNLRSTGRV